MFLVTAKRSPNDFNGYQLGYGHLSERCKSMKGTKKPRQDNASQKELGLNPNTGKWELCVVLGVCIIKALVKFNKRLGYSQFA